MSATGEPILIPCEGSSRMPAMQVNLDGDRSAMCAMCGQWMEPVAGMLPDHQRDDVLRRLGRGDFG